MRDADQIREASAREKQQIAERQYYIRIAVEDALLHERAIKGAMQKKGGWWLESFGPLQAHERTAVINWLKGHWGIE
jgi:hypothetical protein